MTEPTMIDPPGWEPPDPIPCGDGHLACDRCAALVEPSHWNRHVAYHRTASGLFALLGAALTVLTDTADRTPELDAQLEWATRMAKANA